MLEFLKTIHQEQINLLQGLSATEPAEDLKAKALVIKANLNFCSLIYNLPGNVKQAMDDFEQNAIRKARFADAQEGGEI